MKLHKQIGAGTALTVGLALAAPAQAQFGATAKPLSEGTGNRYSTSYELQFYPLAQFSGSGNGLVGYKKGFLYSADVNIVSQRNSGALTLGGWIWSAGDDYIYNVHAQYYLPGKLPLGFQVGTLGAQAGKNDYDAFVVYDFSPRNAASKKTRSWNIAVGLGAYFYGNANTQFTTFAQASFPFSNSWRFQGTYWYIKSPAGYQDRIGLGIGYGF